MKLITKFLLIYLILLMITFLIINKEYSDFDVNVRANYGLSLKSNHCTSNVPVEINSNADFQGWPGSGTEDAPFVIDSLDITSNDILLEALIIIRNVDAYFNITNNCLHGDGSGILIENSTNGLIKFNEIRDNTGAGVALQNSSFINISNNVIENTLDNGIWMRYSKLIDIFNNTILHQDGTGITVVDSTNLRILDNVIALNAGIYLDMKNSFFSQNIINQTTTGLNLPSTATTNHITCNYFSANNIGSPQAKDDGQANVINSNYWSDWTGPDVSPPDGIVDQAYQIAGTAGNSDDIPFISPNELAANTGMCKTGICQEMTVTTTSTEDATFLRYGLFILFPLTLIKRRKIFPR